MNLDGGFLRIETIEELREVVEQPIRTLLVLSRGGDWKLRTVLAQSPWLYGPVTSTRLFRFLAQHQEASEGPLVLDDILDSSVITESILKGALDDHVRWNNQELIVPNRLILIVHDYRKLRHHVAPIYDRCFPILVEE